MLRNQTLKKLQESEIKATETETQPSNPPVVKEHVFMMNVDDVDTDKGQILQRLRRANNKTFYEHILFHAK